jgi:CRISPR-associated protein Csm1
MTAGGRCAKLQQISVEGGGMDEQVLMAALAGLLHDIGKFSQRAGRAKNEQWDQTARDQIKYEHALASYGFVQQFVPKDWRAGLSGVAYHHRPKSRQDYWVQLADWLSSAEREEDEDNRVPRMLSPFSHLMKHNADSFLPLRRLNPFEVDSLFPQPLKDASMREWRREWQDEYAAVWDEFESECKASGLTGLADKTVYLEMILALLQDYTWSIPSAYWNNVPDVSLFDHLRTTAAIAACLAADDQPMEWCKTAKDTNPEVCYLVGADLSGLQNFIYTLASSGAMKSLRARSFYVQLVTEALARAMLSDLSLPITNLLYVGGGGFQFFAPLNAEKTLKSSRRDLAERLLELHSGGLGLTVEWRELHYADFGRFSAAREELGKVINRAKRQPFAAASAEKLAAAIGQPIGLGGDPEKFCKVTGEDGNTLGKDKDGVIKSLFVLSLEELGAVLPKAKYIAYRPVDRHQQAIGRATDWRAALQALGSDVQVLEDASALDAPANEVVRLWELNPLKDGERKPPVSAGRVVSYRPFAKLTPLIGGRPITTDELAVPMEDGCQFKRWAVLRLDVDNLGTTFKDGFKRDDKDGISPSRIASLSFALQLFFEGWLPQLAQPQLDDDHPQAKSNLRKHVYIQYAGGDDVFIVGSWDALPEYARRIRRSFGAYAADNPKLTISGGITIVDEGFPLYQAAEQAHEAESAAKGFTRANGRGKDAITFLGATLDWQDFAEAETMAYELAAAVKDNVMPRAVLQTTLSLVEQVRQAERAQKPAKRLFGPWTWMAAYQLTRMEKRTENDKAAALIRQIQEVFLKPNDRQQFERVALAARWAQYLTRGG